MVASKRSSRARRSEAVSRVGAERRVSVSCSGLSAADGFGGIREGQGLTEDVEVERVRATRAVVVQLAQGGHHRVGPGAAGPSLVDLAHEVAWTDVLVWVTDAAV